MASSHSSALHKHDGIGDSIEAVAEHRATGAHLNATAAVTPENESKDTLYPPAAGSIPPPAALGDPEKQQLAASKVAAPPPDKIPLKGLLSLLALHASSSWNARTCEFAFYLFLIQLFPNTLLPASIYGFCSTGVAILLGGTVGGLVDRVKRLRIVRIFTVAQKVSIIVCSGAFLALFVRTGPMEYRHAPAGAWVAFAAITVLGSVLGLANIGTSVAVERDWVTTVCLATRDDGDGALTRLNTYMRRIDLLSKLLAPLFTSLLTTVASYTFAVAFLMGFAGLTLLFELWWIEVVFDYFPVLAASDKGKPMQLEEPVSAELGQADDPIAAETTLQDHPAPAGPGGTSHHALPDDHIIRVPASHRVRSRAFKLYYDWREFSRMPVFLSSVAISLLYLTTLSFDGTMLSYLKAQGYSDAFLAGQRGICVVTGLAGTVVMPYIERKLGLTRAGAWSIGSEALTLVPVLVSFYVSSPARAGGPAWSQALLFGGMAASRIGLWAFDLCQLKELQLALSTHPKRNRFMGLQFSLQNVADLLKYVLTIVLSRPDQFRWTALASFVSVCLGVFSYALFVKKERGHVFHLEKVPLLRKYA